MLESWEAQDWKLVGHGFLEGYLAVKAVGRSGGLVVAWNKAMFFKDSWMGWFLAPVNLKQRRDEMKKVVISL